MSLDSFLSTLQESSLPGVWSKGIAVSRDATFVPDKVSDEEVIARVQITGRAVSSRVTLWIRDGDWFCDCGDKNDPCAHIIGTALAFKAGRIQTDAQRDRPRRGFIEYRFIRKDGGLAFERWWVRSGQADPQKLTRTLVSLVGGVNSGRLTSPELAVIQEDFTVDRILMERADRALDHSVRVELFRALESIPYLRLDGETVRISSKTVGLRGNLIEQKGHYLARIQLDPRIEEIFSNGIARCGDVLHPLHQPKLSAQEMELFQPQGKKLSKDEIGVWLTEVLPGVESKLSFEILATHLPRLVVGENIQARLQIHMEFMGEDLIAFPQIAYESAGQALATLRGDRLELTDPNRVISRDRENELRLVRESQSELFLKWGEPTRFRRDEQIAFLERTRGQKWVGPAAGRVQMEKELAPRVDFTAGSFDLQFDFSEGEGFAGRPKGISGQTALRAWRENQNYVALADGGWAKLPADWMTKYAERIEDLLAARSSQGKLPTLFQPELAVICEESGFDAPRDLKVLAERINQFEKIPDAALPRGLNATLRDYQKVGVNWLCFLRDLGLGALLADDMGLGKTLQTLCAIQGRTLIVSPTSVLPSWQEQIAKFRPDLKVQVFHRVAGSERKMDPKADVVLTTYAILRLDEKKLSEQKWQTVVLDEAQMIRNPESQAARAAHRIQADFKIALSGTPIENRLSDLWSLFQFLNPGFFGNRAEFQERYAREFGNLRKRLKPFVLRRLKQEVARELPSRTEVQLYCELSPAERDLYQSVWAASRSEVLKNLEAGGNVFGVLETLLRLRQACCHPALVPGAPAELATPSFLSSKVELLMDSLEEAAAENHRALVFSQWTGLLDLLEPELKRRNLGFLRLDGTTSDRAKVVEDFQKPDGPPVFLISLKAGGVGLTLTAADHVYFLDPWWNPFAEAQAADRAHRIGQERPVFIHRLVARDTIEERVLLLQKSKEQLSQSILGGDASGAGGSGLTRDELMEILR